MEFAVFVVVLILAAMIFYTFNHRDQSTSKKKSLPKSYLIGLNFLLNEQPDKAVDLFIDILEVNKDTFETHLAMGNHYRKSGEIDKAIRVHQNLVTHTNLPKKNRVEALSALGEDYLSAGVLDRAERIFHEVVTTEPDARRALEHLLNIYQQEKSWHEAIDIAKRLSVIPSDQTNNTEKYQKIIAQYNCEVAETYALAGNIEDSELFLARALKSNANCARALKIEPKIAAHYRCDHCGYMSKRFSWLCPSCKNWEEIRPCGD